MKIFKAFLMIFLFCTNSAFCQTDKGDWLIGGNTSFTSLNRRINSELKAKESRFNFSPNIGYFILDKLAVGLQPAYNYYKRDSDQSINSFNLGVFSRYYLLKSGLAYNFIVQSGYQHLFNNSTNSYSLATGPVIYFNERIALELNIAYVLNTYNNNSEKYYILKSGIGLQIQLKE